MNATIAKRAAAIALGLAFFSSPVLACDKAASNDRIMKIVAKGDAQRPTRVSEGFALEVTEKYWASVDAKQKQELAADVACAVGSDVVSFMRDRSLLQTYRNGKPQ